MNVTTAFLILLMGHHIGISEAGNVLIFPMLSRSQLLNAARIATILAEDGHNVTIVLSTTDEPDIKKSSAYNLLLYKTSFTREQETELAKMMHKLTPINFLLGQVPLGILEMQTARCIGVLFDEEFISKLQELKPDLAIVHHMVPCIIPHLVRMKIPFIDFCPVPLMHGFCGYPHRVPAPPSYVPHGAFTIEPSSFASRLINTVAFLLVPEVVKRILFGQIQEQLYRYQEQHGLPYEDHMQLRSKASFLLVHGDISYETIRPSLPKVVYMGGIQCDAPKPLEGELKEFVETPDEYKGLIVFSLGGMLNTDGLPPHFLQTFLKIFREMPSYRVVWKLKSVPEDMGEVPANVKIVEWLPQQDLLGHPKTKLFISHGGIQGAFETIYHGVPILGVAINGDQPGNVQLLVAKGMALPIEDYTVMTYDDAKGKIEQLLTEDKYHKNAIKAQKLLSDQPQTAAERLKFTVGYAIRHKGAHHLTSPTASKLHWFSYYSLDVGLFLFTVLILVNLVGYACIKTCFKCCKWTCRRESKSKRE